MDTELEQILQRHLVALHPLHLGDLHDLARAVGQALLWTIRCSAEAICSRMARTGRSNPAISTIVSSRASASRGRVGVDRGQRAVVAGVHRLQHVQRLGAAALADDDPVGPHAQGVAHQVADR